MNDIDLAVWGTYFSIGIVLLIILVIGRQSLQKRAAQREAVARTVIRVKSTYKQHHDTEYNQRPIR